MSQDMISALLWVAGGILGVIGILLATLWQMTRREKEVQDAAIEQVRQLKADKSALEDGEKRLEKEVDRLRVEHEKVVTKLEVRFEKELENVESRIISRFDTRFDSLETMFLKQFDTLMEVVKKDKV